MARPVKERATFEQEERAIVRLLRVLEADTQGTPKWRREVEKRLRECLVLLVNETERRKQKGTR